MSDIDQIGFFTDGPAAIAKAKMADKMAEKEARIAELTAALKIAAPYLHRDTTAKGKADYSIVRAALEA